MFEYSTKAVSKEAEQHKTLQQWGNVAVALGPSPSLQGDFHNDSFKQVSTSTLMTTKTELDLEYLCRTN